MFENYIKSIRLVENTSIFTNPYHKETKNSAIATNNLKLYLNNIYKFKPKILFVGEAPGYKGCRITGIPFTSESILTKKFKKGLFGSENGYKIINKNEPQKENTATIIWETFNSNKKLIPCFWNAFPFHPHYKGDFQTNRKPNKYELEMGIKYTKKLIKILKIKKVIAIGKVSYNLLLKNDIQCEYIRHPANGGKTEFIKGLKKVKYS